MPPILTFVHLSDSHIGPRPDSVYQGLQPAAHLARLVRLINELPHRPDCVIHTGDISHDRSPESYAVAADILAGLAVPIYYVCGNHDQRAPLRQFLNAPPAPNGDPTAPLTYTFEIKGERFLALDTTNKLVRDPLGYLDDTQLNALHAETTSDGPPLTVLIHHTPFTMASPWLDNNMIITNGEALHTALLPIRERLRGVFFGHLHRSSQIVRDGITYICAPSCVSQYHWPPWETLPIPDPTYPPGYHLVHYLPEQVVVFHQTFERP